MERKEGPQEKTVRGKKSGGGGGGVSKDLAANDFRLKVGILDFSVFSRFLGPGPPDREIRKVPFEGGDSFWAPANDPNNDLSNVLLVF